MNAKQITRKNLDDVLAMDPAPRAQAVAATRAGLDKRIADDTARTFWTLAPVVGSLISECRPRGYKGDETFTWSSQAAMGRDAGLSGADVTVLKRLDLAQDHGLIEGSPLHKRLMTSRAIGGALFAECDKFQSLADWQGAFDAADAQAEAEAEASRNVGLTDETVTTMTDEQVEAAVAAYAEQVEEELAAAETYAVEAVEVDDTRAARPDVATVDPRRSPVDALHLITVEVQAGRMSKETRRDMVAALSLLMDALDAAR